MNACILADIINMLCALLIRRCVCLFVWLFDMYDCLICLQYTSVAFFFRPSIQISVSFFFHPSIQIAGFCFGIGSHEPNDASDVAEKRSRTARAPTPTASIHLSVLFWQNSGAEGCGGKSTNVLGPANDFDMYIIDNLLPIIYTHLSGTRMLNGRPEVYPTAVSPVII
jgi:hypothetical protein